MMILSLFIPFLGLILAIKNRNNFTRLLCYLILFFLNLLFVYLIIRLIDGLGVFTWLKENSPFKVFGQKPLCNQRSDRALHIGDFVFPLCYRCMGIWISLFGYFLLSLIFRPKQKKIMIALSIFFIFPCFIDGLAQTLSSYESKNIIRFITGFLAGSGTAMLLYYFLNKTFHLEKEKGR